MARNQQLLALYHRDVYSFSWLGPFGVFYRNKLGRETSGSRRALHDFGHLVISACLSGSWAVVVLHEYQQKIYSHQNELCYLLIWFLTSHISVSQIELE